MKRTTELIHLCMKICLLIILLTSGYPLLAGEPAGNTDGSLESIGRGLTIDGHPNNPALLDTGDVIHTIAAPGLRCQGLTYDGQYLWVSDIQTDLIYKISPVYGEVRNSFAAPGDFIEGLAFDGAYLWAASNGGQGAYPDTLYKIDPANGNVVSFIELSLRYVQGITFDNENLWAVDFYSHAIYELNPDDGEVISSFATPGDGAIGLAWDSTFLWTNDFNTDSLYQMNPYNGAVIRTVPSPHTNPRDMAWNGYYLWVLAWQNATIYLVDVGGPPTTIDACNSLPTSFGLLDNYPNPFNGRTTISYRLPNTSHVRIDIFDLLGRAVNTLVDEQMKSGQHSLIWDCRNSRGQQVSSGIYFYRLQTDEATDTRRMVLLK